MELLVIGLDGLSYNMLDRFGIEPEFIERTRSAGVSGDLMSVDTPTTLPAWTSFATGKDPGTHGMTNMISQASNYETSPLEPQAAEPAAYDLIEDAVFVNLPASAGRSPAAEGTHLVSAMMSKDKYDAVPEHLQELDAFEEYILDHDKGKKVRPGDYFDHVCEITRARRDFAREAFETYEPRFGFVLFSTPDWAGHLLSNFGSDEERAKYYRQLLTVVDECTASLAAVAENVVLMSDHGFEHKRQNVHLNDWLADEKYLYGRTSWRSPQELLVDAATSVASRSDRLYEWMRQAYNYLIGTSVGQNLQGAVQPDIDFERSLAWQLRYGCIYLNDDRFDHPTVENPDALAKELRDRLRELADDDGEAVFRDVLLADEAYNDPGPQAPDVIARPAPGRYPTMLSSPTGGYVSPTNNYNHRYRGIFVGTGPLFTDGTVEGMSIIDILPTLLHALNEPLLKGFDGVARGDVLAADHQPQYRSSTAVPNPRTESKTGTVSQTERDAAVEQRLEDLGYLE